MGSKVQTIDQTEADTVMAYVLEHYIKHYQAVMRKLGHAKTATHKSMEEISKASDQDKLSEIKPYDGMWAKIIELYSNSGVSEEELAKIDRILSEMPKLIKKHYAGLVESDHVLQDLITELQSEEYQTAIERTRQVQSRLDEMSGLSPSEYDLGEQVHQNAFMFKVHNNRH